jgi:hypothetical protein
MRLIVTGSRTWEGPLATKRIEGVLTVLHVWLDMLGEPLIVVHGACPTGADQITDAWATKRVDEGVTVEAHPADWKRWGKGAGPRRNQYMLDQGADMCIGFRRGNSSGTGHMLAIARHAKILTFEVPWKEGK